MTRRPFSPWRIVRVVLLATVVALAVALATQALWLAPLLSHHLTARSGRAVHVDTMWVGLSSSFAPVLQFRGVRIANAAWADPDHPFAELARATAVFSWTSVEQRRPVVALFILADGEIDLERTADGLRNWRLTNPDYRGPGRWKVLAVQGERATVRFRHHGLDLDVRATASAVPAGPAASETTPLTTHLDLDGHWRELAFSMSAETGPVLTFLETGATFPIRGRLEAAGAHFDLDGTAGDIASRPNVDASVDFAATSLAPFSAFVASRHGAAKALRLQGVLKTGDDRYALSAMKARVGATDLAGELSWARRDERRVVQAKLESDSTDVADLRWLSGLAAAHPAMAAASAPLAASSSATGRHSSTRDLDAELAFVARRLRAAEVPELQDGRLEAKLVDGQLTVSRFEVGLARGRVDGRVSLALDDAPMRAEADVTARGVRIEPFVRDAADKSRITGALHGHALLKARGDSIASLRDSLSGRVTASLTGGTISSLLDAEIGLQGGKIVRSLIGGAEPLPIRCAVAVLDLDRGAGRVQELVFDTERTRTVGRGTIDLGAGTVDIVLTPEAKQGGLFNLDRSIRVHGPLRHPAHNLVARVPASPPARNGCARS